jgi:serine/threonine-protein kinase
MGLIHRDIKPANVLLCLRGRTPDVAKVVDFGLVKELTRDSDLSTKILTGTPAYLAPEAISDPDRVGPQSDLYALGALAYFLVTGHRVFTGKTSVDVCVQHVSTPPVPPSRRTERPVPAGLEGVILACLEKDPARRPSDARTLARTLAELPEAAEWDEDAAMEWWRHFDARRRSDARPAPAVRVGAITVDLANRAALHEALTQPSATAQAM